MGTMESKKKLSMPPGNVHDIRYLYTIIAGVKQRGGRVPRNDALLDYLSKLINDYNEAKATRYGLSFRPKGVNIKVVKHALAELRYLGLMDRYDGHMVLTAAGEAVAGLISARESAELKTIFAQLMLENFRIFEFLLRRISEVSSGAGVPIPQIAAGILDKCEGDWRAIAGKYISIASRSCPMVFANAGGLYTSLEAEGIESVDKRTEKLNKLQSIIEKFIVSQVFGPVIQSRRAYDCVRSRTTFLELTNYGTFDFEGFPAEVAYLIADFERPFAAGTKDVRYRGGKLYVNHPAFEKVRDAFTSYLWEAYESGKDEFGYMKIADMRDAVCRKLRISDDLFNEYLKRLYSEEPHSLSLTYLGAEERITEKRLPVVFEKPVRELFTLIKVNMRR